MPLLANVGKNFVCEEFCMPLLANVGITYTHAQPTHTQTHPPTPPSHSHHPSCRPSNPTACLKSHDRVGAISAPPMLTSGRAAENGENGENGDAPAPPEEKKKGHARGRACAHARASRSHSLICRSLLLSCRSPLLFCRLDLYMCSSFFLMLYSCKSFSMKFN